MKPRFYNLFKPVKQQEQNAQSLQASIAIPEPMHHGRESPDNHNWMNSALFMWAAPILSLLRLLALKAESKDIFISYNTRSCSKKHS